ncbi:MAG: alpha/beta fold hydrolase, partial [Planctomycetota bacterium]
MRHEPFGRLGALALAIGCGSAAAAQTTTAPQDTLELKRVTTSTGVEMHTGTFPVFENRATMTGRQIHLDVVVLPATGDDPLPDPIVMVAGGPGEAVTNGAAWSAQLPLRRTRDIVFIDQRGTNGDHELACELPGSDENLQGYLGDEFDPAIYRDCLEQLRGRADLTQYSTVHAADDLADVLTALGYDRVNLVGGSYGTRASLVFMRRHPSRVRTATLIGIAPIEFTNPLYHAEGAQRAIEMIFDRCAADPACHEAFCDLPREFEEILQRLEVAPARTHVLHPETGTRVDVTLSRYAFAEA